MVDTTALIQQLYTAFNTRDIGAALALMTPDVTWPKASEGGRVLGTEEIRSYWTRQWKEFDPHVDPISIADNDGGRIHVRVHQLVKSLSGEVLSDTEVLHIYTVVDGRVAAMHLGDETSDTAAPSAAFAHRS